MLIYLKIELKILKWESSIFKSCEILRVFLIYEKERRSNDCWLQPWVNSAVQKLAERKQWVECASVSFTLLKSWESSAPSPPLMAWFDLLSCCLLYDYILYLIIAAITFLAVQQNWTIPSTLSKVTLLDSPPLYLQLPFSAALHPWNEYSGTTHQVTHSFAVSVLSLKNVTEVNQAIKFESS